MTIEALHPLAGFGLAFIVGIAAGVLNTLAGAGSLLTLPAFLLMGLSPHAANATNRVGILFQNAAAIYSYRRHGGFTFPNWRWLAAPASLGALLGALAAALLSPRNMSLAIAAVLVLSLGLLFLNPDQWLRSVSEANDRHKSALGLAGMFALGFYGGFIQAAAGVLLIAFFALYLRQNLVDANGLKLLIVLFFTVPALAVFIYYDQVDWSAGLAAAAGQACGAFLAARFAVKSPRANIWIRRLLIAVTTLSLLKLGWDEKSAFVEW